MADKSLIEEIYEFIFNYPELDNSKIISVNSKEGSPEGYRWYCSSVGSKDLHWAEDKFESKEFVKSIIGLGKTGQNQYVSPNIIVSDESRKSDAKYITNLVIDVDSHSIKVLPDTLKSLEMLINANVEYTLCTYSGRGLHFWYNMDPVEFSREVKSQYIHCVTKLCEIINKIIKEHEEFSALSVDIGASKRTNGIIRLPFSHNPKAGVDTEVKFNRVRYSLSELAVKLGYNKDLRNKGTKNKDLKNKDTENKEPVYRSIAKEKSKVMYQVILRDNLNGKEILRSRFNIIVVGSAKSQQLTGRGKKGRISEKTSFMGQLQKRIVMLESLVTDRTAEHKRTKNRNPVELRHNTLLIYYSSQVGLLGALARDEWSEGLARSQAVEKTKELNKKFMYPYDREELKKLLKSVDEVEGVKTGRHSYAFTNKQIIEMVQLTEEEQARYNFYSAKGESSEFDYSKMTSNKTREAVRKQRKEKKKTEKEQILRLFENGCTKAEVAKRTGYSIPTVSKLIEESGVSKKEQVLSLFKQGYTKAEVAREVGYSKPLVSKLIKASGLSEESNAIKVQQQKHKGKNQAETAKILGLGIATVKRYW